MARPFGTKYIKTPEIMWELFCDYRQHIWNNPIMIIEQKKGNTIVPKGINIDYDKLLSPIVEMPLRRPLTIEGFENYCFEVAQIITDLGDYFKNREDSYSDFSPICQRIKKIIREDQIEGGMAGIFNPSITQRLNNLVEKTQNENVNKDVPLFPDVPTDDSDKQDT